MTSQQKNEPNLFVGLAMVAFIFFGIPLAIAFLLPIPRMLLAKALNPSKPMPIHPFFEEPRPLTAREQEELYWEELRESRKPRFER
jgi:hypothetical protein